MPGFILCGSQETRSEILYSFCARRCVRVRGRPPNLPYFAQSGSGRQKDSTWCLSAALPSKAVGHPGTGKGWEDPAREAPNLPLPSGRSGPYRVWQLRQEGRKGGRQEGRKERRHSCCPVYVAAGKAPATVGGAGRLLSPPRPAPGREGVVPEPWDLTLSPLGLAPWPQECGGGEEEPGATGMRTAAAAGSRDVRPHLPGQLLVGRGVKSRGSPGPRGAAYL